MAGAAVAMEGVKTVGASDVTENGGLHGVDELQTEVIGLLERTATVVEKLATASPANPIDPTLCKSYLEEVDRLQNLFNHHISVLEEERTELQPSGGIHGDELDTTIATAALDLTQSRVETLIELTAQAPTETTKS
eukprot:m.25502 g.25502  ORF g.25502 m.25502 type:complete len:136 (+) comp6204_c0_seq1:113-520(+)